MRLMLLVLIMVASVFYANAHDIHKATFTFQRIDGQLMLRTDLDRHDLMKYFELEGMECSEKNISFCLEELMDQHLSASISGQKLTFTYVRSELQKEYVIGWFAIEPSFQEIDNIVVTTDMFVEYMPKYQNIMNCELGPKFVSYQLTSERRTVTIVP